MNLGRVAGVALRTGVPFGLILGVLQGARHGLLPGLVGGVLSGVLFGIAMGVFAEYQRKRLAIPGPYEGEEIVFQGPANHWRGVQARGGWLLLTPTRLVFRAHGVNLDTGTLAIPLAEVRAFEPARSMLVIPNALRVARRDGSSESFVVSDRGGWLTAAAGRAS